MAALTSVSPVAKRGAFILFEGVDRCGKSSQAALLAKYLSEKAESSSSSELIRFPDRTSSIGTLINSYLQSTSNLSDQAIHLLFSANRWETSDSLRAKLEAGTTLVCDRYAYSGVAFSSAKGLELDWCKACDRGLPAPDCVIYLDIPVEEAAKRGNYGEERYEKIEFQAQIRAQFMALRAQDDATTTSTTSTPTQSAAATPAATTAATTPAESKKPTWHVLDAAQSIEALHACIAQIADNAVAEVQAQPLKQLWMD